MIIVTIVFENLRFQNVFPFHQNAKPTYLNSFGLKSVFKKLRFRDGLKLRFQIYPAIYLQGL